MKRAILLVVFFSISTYSQTIDYFSFYIGNQYEWKISDSDSTVVKKITNIIESSDSGTDIYFDGNETPQYYEALNGNVYKYFGENKYLWYDFTVSIGDTFYIDAGFDQYTVVVESISDMEIFGNAVETHRFVYYGNSDFNATTIVAKGFGEYHFENANSQQQVDLVGCQINGNTHGTMVGIKETSNLKEKFKLQQNYPNPFNPKTVINYSIGQSGIVTIIVYNSIGKTIATLVNKFQKTGNHKTIFNGDNLSSGVYYYTIKTDKFRLTKKMLLLK